MDDQGVSGRQLAEMLEVTEAAVRKARKTGRIKPKSNGLYDPDECREAWGKSTDPASTKVRTSVSTQVRTKADDKVRTPVASVDDAREAVSLIARVLQEEGGAAVGVVDFGAARTAETILKARERDLNIAQKRGELVPAAAVAKYVGEQFVKFKQAVQRIPARFSAQLAGELGCDPHQLDAVLSKTIAA